MPFFKDSIEIFSSDWELSVPPHLNFNLTVLIGGALFGQEPMSRSMQLHYIPVTAFS